MSPDERDRPGVTATRRGVLGATTATVTGLAGCFGGGETTATPRTQGACEGVEPSLETARSGEYAPLTRPLYVYINRAELRRPEVALFARGLVDHSGSDTLSNAGYVARTESEVESLRADLDAAIADVGGPPPGEEEPEGQVDVTGSVTMFKLTRGFARKFQRKNPGASVGIQTTGTRGGFRQFLCAGRSEVNNAARRITEAERSRCRDNGVELLELQIAADPITVVINTDNDWVPCLTVSELARIWGSDGVDRWSQISSDWPDEPVELVAPPDTSATHAYFRAAILGSGGRHASDYSARDPDEVIPKGVSGNRYALGYVGHTFYVRTSGDATPVAIDPSG